MKRQVQHLVMNYWVAEREGETRDPGKHGHRTLSEVEETTLCLAAEREGYMVRIDDEWRLTPKGEGVARRLLRRHRLAERLLHDLMELPEKDFEESACRFEHHLSADACERICTLLGHPTTCPHGRVIPPGDCCRARLRTVEPIVERLKHLHPGDRARVVFISPDGGNRLQKLQELGFSPGSEIVLVQKQPSFVVQAGETEVALDESVAEIVFVSRMLPPAADSGGVTSQNNGNKLWSLKRIFTREGDKGHTERKASRRMIRSN